MKKLKVYYAHSMHLYHKPQEQRDVETLEQLGFEVINPSSQEIHDDFERWKSKTSEQVNIMSYFDKWIKEADALAFRAYPDGTIGSGVAYEIARAKLIVRPIFELPNLFPSRNRSYEDTKEMLKLLGER